MLQRYGSLEFGLMATILSVAAAMLLHWLLYFQEKSEKTRVEATIHSLESALKKRMGDMMIHSQAHRWDKLTRENPFNWLDKKPGDYCGELDKLAPGCWVYDAAQHGIIYQVNRKKHFQGSWKDDTIRLKLIPKYTGSSSTMAASVELRLMQPYHWFEEEE